MARFSGIRIKNLGSFQNVLEEYMKYTKRTLPVILNTKAFYIARGAARETPKADKARIDHELGEIYRTLKVNKKGKLVGDKKVFVQAFGSSGDSRAALIINARRKKKGQPGLHGTKLYRAILKMLAARKKSIAFIKSGWLRSIKIFEPLAEKKSRAPKVRMSELKQFGQAKGDGKAAVNSWRPYAVIINSASGDHDKNGALEKYGKPALVLAWGLEIASMKQYIEDKLRKGAKDQGIKTN